jgi:hypothetical protein
VNCDTAIFAWCTWKHLSVPDANGQAIEERISSGDSMNVR